MITDNDVIDVDDLKGECNKLFKGKVILVTGGTGSFGHYIIRELLNFDAKTIVVFSRDEDKQYKMEMEYKGGRVSFAPGDVFNKSDEEQMLIRKNWKEDNLNFAVGDVRDLERVREITKGIDIIYHAAALKQVPFSEFHPVETIKTNVLGAYNIKLAAIENKVDKVIAISTDKAVKPVNAMGMSKALQEKILLSEGEIKYSTKFICVRYGNVLGSRGSVVPVFEEKISRGEPLTLTHKDMTRFILTLEDAVNLVLYATVHGTGGEVFVKKAPALKIPDLAHVFSQALTDKNDYPMNVTGIRPGEKIHEVLVSEDEMYRTKEEENYYVVYPYNFYLNMKENGNLGFFNKSNNVTEYTSAVTNILSKDEILSLLKKTGWI